MATDENEKKAANTEELLRFLDSVPSNSDAGRPIKTRKASCPSAHLYMEVALGTADQVTGQALLDHACECKECAQTLAASLRALDDEPDQEELDAIAESPLAQTSGQEELSRRLAASAARRHPAISAMLRSRSVWVGIGAAAAVALAALGVTLWQRHAGAPELLLAKAYEESRTLELRIPDAQYAALKPGTHTRGTADEDESAALFEARARLTRTLQHTPQDARSLELQARADTLEEHYDAAIDILDRLVATGPLTAELLTDAATAYFQRGLISNRETDRSTALDYLRRADQMMPADPVVLFNEAIVMQDRGQLMNAVEVWNRYITVERDPHWAAEGKRKLAELETILDRIKSHESRLMRMLATPEAMDALAADAAKLARWDEELSSVELDKVLNLAFPEMPAPQQAQARGSPCEAMCMAARRLLYTTGHSLQTHHNDDWLTDLLPPHIENLSLDIQAEYTQGMRALARAVRENQTGLETESKKFSWLARNAFLDLEQKTRNDPTAQKASRTGEERAAAEYLYALQKSTDFAGCRLFADKETQRIHEQHDEMAWKRHPWIRAFFLMTERVCDTTADSRDLGQQRISQAFVLIAKAKYGLLYSRARIRTMAAAQLLGDEEQADHIYGEILKELLSGDPPIIRMMNTEVAAMEYNESPSSHPYKKVLDLREALSWGHAAGDFRTETLMRKQEAIAEIQVGEIQQAETELRLSRNLAAGLSGKLNFAEESTAMAEALLEQGDFNDAQTALDENTSSRAKDSDPWFLAREAAITGQLELERGNYAAAEQSLKEAIHRSEGKHATMANRETAAEFAMQDHDLYAELAAAWLEDGHPPEDVLALWERFRLRSQGLPIPDCPADHLNCQREQVLSEQAHIGPDRMTGQILLMDRVLVYQMDAPGIHWRTHKRRRRDVMDMVLALQRAVSSPMTSLATAQLLGQHLTEALLPALPESLPQGATLLLEPDPRLRSVAWPVLPMNHEPLGLNYAVAEIPSILSHSTELQEHAASHSSAESGHPLVIGASLAGPEEVPLPEVIDEARYVSGFLDAPRLLVGGEATIQSVTKDLPAATLLHFAGHAVPSREGTRLLLAADGIKADSPQAKQPVKPWIDGAFLQTHPPRHCRLAVLSACATGQSSSSTDPLQDLVGTLYAIGVPQIVATRWQVDSGASVPLMKTFYSNLASGNGAARAMQIARKLQFSNSSYNNPYYWGAYYVTGREFPRSEGKLYAGISVKASRGVF